MEKTEYIKSLANTKLVLGNGFDLHCKLQSSYKDYYLENKGKYNEILSWVDSFIQLLDDGKSFYEIKLKINFDEYNVWDFLLAFEKHRFSRNEKDYKWCDIESLIYRSLVVKDICYAPIDWAKAYMIYSQKLRTGDTYENAISNIFYLKKNGEEFHGEDEYYHFLLDELKKFEVEFGSFILNRQINQNKRWFSIGLVNDKYFKCVEKTLNDLCILNNIVSIDTFNYSYITQSEIGGIDFKGAYHHINGDFAAPIFGIDSTLSPSDKKYIFTKSYRRMEASMDSNEYNDDPPFEHLIIYGHSLNEADYGYFFSMFDRLNLIDSLANSLLIFAYSIYDETKKSQILIDLKINVSKLIYKYALFKKIESPERIIDYLFLQNKIIFQEIPELTGLVYNFPSHFDIKENEK